MSVYALRCTTLSAPTTHRRRSAQAILTLPSEYGRNGYRRITKRLRDAGWPVGKDRVPRIWRREGLKVPAKQKPRGRLWLNDGSCIRLRPQHRNHVWSYDFVEARTRLLTLIDEYTRECLAIRVARRLNSHHVIEALGGMRFCGTGCRNTCAATTAQRCG
jgi:putative transposase